MMRGKYKNSSVKRSETASVQSELDVCSNSLASSRLRIEALEAELASSKDNFAKRILVLTEQLETNTSSRVETLEAELKSVRDELDAFRVEVKQHNKTLRKQHGRIVKYFAQMNGGNTALGMHQLMGIIGNYNGYTDFYGVKDKLPEELAVSLTEVRSARNDFASSLAKRGK